MWTWERKCSRGDESAVIQLLSRGAVDPVVVSAAIVS